MPTDFLAGAKRIGDLPKQDDDFLAGATRVDDPQRTYTAPPLVPDQHRPTFMGRLEETSPLGLIKGMVSSPGRTIESLPSGIVGELKRSANQLKQAWNTPDNQPLQAIDRTLYAIPFIGSGLKNADEDAKNGDLGAAAGGVLGTVGSIALGRMAAGSAIDAIPTKAKAASLLDQAGQKIGDAPVTLTRTTPALEEAQRLSTYGHGSIKPLDSLYARMNQVQPLGYIEARGRYSPITQLTVNDRLGATKTLRGATKGVAAALKDDIGDVADQYGAGDEYRNGMKMYAQASRNASIAKGLGLAAASSAIPGFPLAKKIYDLLK